MKRKLLVLAVLVGICVFTLADRPPSAAASSYSIPPGRSEACVPPLSAASTQRDRHPAQQNVSQAKSVLSIEGGYCLGYNVIGMPAQRQTIFFTACRQPGDGQGLTAMPFGDGPRRGFRNSRKECDVA